MELDTIIVVRCSFQNNITRVDKKSIAYSSLAKEYPSIQRRNTPLFKNEAVYIPILHSWRTKKMHVIGTVILSGFDEEVKNSLSDGIMGERSAKIANEGLLRDVMDQVSFFVNLCIIDMNYRKKDDNFRSMSNMSKKIIFFILKINSVNVQIR